MTSYGPAQFQTKGYCHDKVCGPIQTSVEATSNGTDCWCGNSLPPISAKVDNKFCNVNCAGYGALEQCGGDGYFSVYETGYGTVDNSGSDSSASSSTSSVVPQTTSTPTTSATPSVVTVGGQTIVITASASVTPTSTPASSKPGPNKAAIAAGVVVGFVAIGAAVGGLFMFLRHRRNRQVEEEYRRNAAVSSFISGGKPPSSSGGASSFTDTRLDPSVAQRRMSDGSIADNQDYSRRILKVTNA